MTGCMLACFHFSLFTVHGSTFYFAGLFVTPLPLVSLFSSLCVHRVSVSYPDSAPCASWPHPAAKSADAWMSKPNLFVYPCPRLLAPLHEHPLPAAHAPIPLPVGWTAEAGWIPTWLWWETRVSAATYPSECRHYPLPCFNTSSLFSLYSDNNYIADNCSVVYASILFSTWNIEENTHNYHDFKSLQKLDYQIIKAQQCKIPDASALSFSIDDRISCNRIMCVHQAGASTWGVNDVGLWYDMIFIQ